MVSQTISSTMQAAYLDAPGEVTIRTIDVPAIDADQVLVKVRAVGVCGSDVHYYRHGKLGDYVLDQPLILGHELAGEIVQVGEDVSPDRLGERVAIEPQRPCRSCEECLAGRYNLCPNMEFYAAPPTDGAFAEYVTIQSIFAHTIPEGVGFEEAALAEPLSVGVYACRKGGVTVGSRVLVTGAGPIGIVSAQCAYAYGAKEVYITDISAERREFAASVSGAIPLDPSATDLSALAVDVLLEASGAEVALRSGIGAVRRSGSVVMVGVGPNDMTLPVVEIRDRELVLSGIMRYRHTWPEALGLIKSGRVDVSALITSRFALTETKSALEASSRPGEVKSIVLPSSEDLGLATHASPAN